VIPPSGISRASARRRQGGPSLALRLDADHDVGATTDQFVLRATPFDQERNRGGTVYSRIVVRTAP